MTKFKYGCMNSYMELRNEYKNGGMHIWMAECIYGWRNAYMDNGMHKQMAKCI